MDWNDYIWLYSPEMQDKIRKGLEEQNKAIEEYRAWLRRNFKPYSRRDTKDNAVQSSRVMDHEQGDIK